MGTLSCCCCPFDLDDLPVVTKDGWTAGEWSFDSGTCCANIVLTPNVGTCTATFVDGDFLDYNSETRTFVCNHWLLLENFYTASATYDGDIIIPPAVDCNACETPFICGSQLFEQQFDVATRFGLLYAPHEIRVSICFETVECPEEEPVKKYVVRSVYYYKAKTYIKKYLWTSTRNEITASGCCTGSEDNSDFQPEPDFSSAGFWGINFDCDEVADGSVVSFTRYSVLDNLPTGEVSFANDDCRLCPADLDEECVTEICFQSEGVSDPTNGGITIDCGEFEVRSVVCEVASVFGSCNVLYYYTDPLNPELGIQCDFRPPTFPSPTKAVCGPWSVTHRGIFRVSDTTPVDCSTIPDCGAVGDFDTCLFEGVCPDPSRRLAASWTDTTLMTFTNTCTGGTDAEACIPAPAWSVTFT